MEKKVNFCIFATRSVFGLLPAVLWCAGWIVRAQGAGKRSETSRATLWAWFLRLLRAQRLIQGAIVAPGAVRCPTGFTFPGSHTLKNSNPGFWKLRFAQNTVL